MWMTIDGLTSTGAAAVQATNAATAMMATAGMMVTPASVMASVMVVMVMVLLVLTVNRPRATIAVSTADTGAAGGIGSPLAAAVGVIEERILMRLRIGMQIVVDFGLQLGNGRSGGS